MPRRKRKPTDVSRPRRTASWAIASTLLLAVAVGCRDNENSLGENAAPSPAAPETRAATASPESPTIDRDVPDRAIVLVRGGQVSVTDEDVRRFLSALADATGADESALVPPPGAATERFARRVFEHQLLLADAERLGLGQRIDEEAVRARLAEGTSPGSGAAVAGTTGTGQRVAAAGGELDPAALLVRADLLQQEWMELVQSRISERAIRAWYERQTDEAILELFRMSNVPPPDAIDRAVERRGEEIVSYYESNPSRFRLPASARVTEVTALGSTDCGALPSRALSLAQRLADADDQTTLEAGGLRARSRGWVVPLQEPLAFGFEEPGVSEVERSESGCRVVVVHERRAPRIRPLDATVRREIGARLLRHSVPQPENLSLMQAIADRLATDPDAARQLADERPLVRVQTTPPFGPHRGDSVPIIGESAALMDWTFAEERAVGDTTPEPMLIDGQLVVARLVERTRPSDQDFAQSRDDVERSYRQYVRQTAWSARVEQFLQEHGGLDVDAEALAQLLDEIAPERAEPRVPERSRDPAHEPTQRGGDAAPSPE